MKLLRWRNILGNITLVLILVLLIVFYRSVYSHSGEQWTMQCGFHELTGWLCPGCGGQRAFSHLLNGNVLAALGHNLMIIIILPLLLYIYLVLGQIYLVGNQNFRKYLVLKPWHAYVFLLVLLIFFIVRNIPTYPFTLLNP